MVTVLERALGFGVFASATTFLLSMVSLFLVFGDGTAPGFTHFMISLSELPTRLLGLKGSKYLFVIGSLFWGVVVALLSIPLQMMFKK